MQTIDGSERTYYNISKDAYEVAQYRVRLLRKSVSLIGDRITELPHINIYPNGILVDNRRDTWFDIRTEYSTDPSISRDGSWFTRCTPYNETALHSACTVSSIPAMHYLLQPANRNCGGYIDDTSDDGVSAMSICIANDFDEGVILLLEQGASPMKCGMYEQTMMHRCAKAKAHRCMEILIAAGAPVDDADMYGHTPLQVCLNDFHVFEAGAKMLLVNGANVERLKQVNLIDSALVYSIVNKSNDLAKVLMYHGANFTQEVELKDDNSPSNGISFRLPAYAYIERNFDIIPFLLNLNVEMAAELIRETALVDRDNELRRDQFTQNNGLGDDLGNMIYDLSKRVPDMFKVQRNAVRNVEPGGVFEP
jgi:ankyrin repeat protein